MLLKDCLDEYIYECECRHLSKGTLRNYRAQISFLFAYLEERGIREIEDVKPQHIRDFLRKKQDEGCKPNYINDLLKAHKTLFNYLEEEGYVSQNAAAKVRNVRKPKVIIEASQKNMPPEILSAVSANK